MKILAIFGLIFIFGVTKSFANENYCRENNIDLAIVAYPNRCDLYIVCARYNTYIESCEPNTIFIAYNTTYGTCEPGKYKIIIYDL